MHSTCAERYGGKSKQASHLLAPESCGDDFGSTDHSTPESQQGSPDSAPADVQQEVSFALNDGGIVTYAVGSGSTTPRLPPPTMNIQQSEGETDRRSSRFLQLEAAASAVRAGWSTVNN